MLRNLLNWLQLYAVSNQLCIFESNTYGFNLYAGMNPGNYRNGPAPQSLNLVDIKPLWHIQTYEFDQLR